MKISPMIDLRWLNRSVRDPSTTVRCARPPHSAAITLPVNKLRLLIWQVDCSTLVKGVLFCSMLRTLKVLEIIYIAYIFYFHAICYIMFHSIPGQERTLSWMLTTHNKKHISIIVWNVIVSLTGKNMCAYLRVTYPEEFIVMNCLFLQAHTILFKKIHNLKTTRHSKQRNSSATGKKFLTANWKRPKGPYFQQAINNEPRTVSSNKITTSRFQSILKRAKWVSIEITLGYSKGNVTFPNNRKYLPNPKGDYCQSQEK